MEREESKWYLLNEESWEGRREMLMEVQANRSDG